LAKPEFDVVTGVSTGTLISPFAFLGDDESIDTIEGLDRDPKKDWVKKRWPLYFLPSHQSFATLPGLERELRELVTMSMIRRISDSSKQGRFLIVNTSDIDDGSSHMWDIASEAQRAAEMANSAASRAFCWLQRESLGHFHSEKLMDPFTSTAALPETFYSPGAFARKTLAPNRTSTAYHRA
jgi:hypothetical protein